MNPAMINEFVN